MTKRLNLTFLTLHITPDGFEVRYPPPGADVTASGWITEHMMDFSALVDWLAVHTADPETLAAKQDVKQAAADKNAANAPHRKLTARIEISADSFDALHQTLMTIDRNFDKLQEAPEALTMFIVNEKDAGASVRLDYDPDMTGRKYQRELEQRFAATLRAAAQADLSPFKATDNENAIDPLAGTPDGLAE